jgi:phage terminase large subunit-like protein
VNVSRSELSRIVVAIDPAGSANEDSDDTGIIVVAKGPHRVEEQAEVKCQYPDCGGHGYVLDDRTCHLLPHEWAAVALDAYDYWKADRVVAERNFGADMVENTVRAVRRGVPFTAEWASRGKRVRAEPVAALYEQGRIHHLGIFEELEQEQQTWTPDERWSPNRLDALVWGLTNLGLIKGGPGALLTAKGEVPRNTVSQRERELNGGRDSRQLPPHLRRLARNSGLR